MKSLRSIVGTRETVTVDSMTSVLDAARVMSERHIGAVPVVDGERLAGIFTERDVMSRIVAGARDPRATPVAEVMSTELVVADITETCEACLSRIHEVNSALRMAFGGPLDDFVDRAVRAKTERIAIASHLKVAFRLNHISQRQLAKPAAKM